MRKESCFRLGKITKVKGFKGEMSIFIDVGSPKDYTTLESIFVEIHQKLIPFFVDKLSVSSKSKVTLRLSGIDDEEKAAPLVNAQVYLPLDLMPQSDENQLLLNALIGYRVTDKKLGVVGEVIDFFEIPGNTLLNVSTPKGEVMIPINGANFQDAQKEILVDLPEGLLDLNAE